MADLFQEKGESSAAAGGKSTTPGRRGAVQVRAGQKQVKSSSKSSKQTVGKGLYLSVSLLCYSVQDLIITDVCVNRKSVPRITQQPDDDSVCHYASLCQVYQTQRCQSCVYVSQLDQFSFIFVVVVIVIIVGGTSTGR
mgnify:CR=1 FL=1